jgi:hypothetical protein
MTGKDRPLVDPAIAVAETIRQIDPAGRALYNSGGRLDDPPRYGYPVTRRAE